MDNAVPTCNNKAINITNNQYQINLASTLSAIFTRIIQRNKEANLYYSSNFDCKSTINIAFTDYLYRIYHFTNAQPSTILYSLALVDEACKTKKIYLTENNAHKVYLAALIISIKLNEDDILSDHRYSLIGGIPISEYVEIEYSFMQLINYQLYIPEKKFQIYYNSLSKYFL